MDVEIKDLTVKVKDKTVLDKLNLKLIQKEEFVLPIENSSRTIIKIEKTKDISSKYPRNFAKIKQNPL